MVANDLAVLFDNRRKRSLAAYFDPLDDVYPVSVLLCPSHVMGSFYGQQHLGMARKLGQKNGVMDSMMDSRVAKYMKEKEGF